MDNNYFITITGTKHYYGMKPFEIGRIIKLVKEPYNEYDSEAIKPELPFIDKIGYVANSVNTVVKGTCSGGRIYNSFNAEALAKVLFVTHQSVICLLITQNEDKNKEFECVESADPIAVYEKVEIRFNI